MPRQPFRRSNGSAAVLTSSSALPQGAQPTAPVIGPSANVGQAGDAGRVSGGPQVIGDAGRFSRSASLSHKGRRRSVRGPTGRYCATFGHCGSLPRCSGSLGKPAIHLRENPRVRVQAQVLLYRAASPTVLGHVITSNPKLPLDAVPTFLLDCPSTSSHFRCLLSDGLQQQSGEVLRAEAGCRCGSPRCTVATLLSGASMEGLDAC